MGPRAGLDRCRKSRLHRDSIPGPSSPSPVAIPTKTICRTTQTVWKSAGRAPSLDECGPCPVFGRVRAVPRLCGNFTARARFVKISEMTAVLYFGEKMDSFAWARSVFYYNLGGIRYWNAACTWQCIPASVRYVKTAVSQECSFARKLCMFARIWSCLQKFTKFGQCKPRFMCRGK